MARKLELNRETLRDLTDEALTEVGGGNGVTTEIFDLDTQTFVCPSGATWFWDCQSAQVSCG